MYVSFDGWLLTQIRPVSHLLTSNDPLFGFKLRSDTLLMWLSSSQHA